MERKLKVGFISTILICLTSFFYIATYSDFIKFHVYRFMDTDNDRNVTSAASENFSHVGHVTLCDHDKIIGERPVCKQATGMKKELISCDLERSPPRNTNLMVNMTTLPESFLEVEHGWNLKSGGLYVPTTCSSTQRVAIVIPFRDRQTHLKILLNNLHPFLKKQKLEYMIFVVEQAPGSQMNRGMVSNIGFIEAEKICHFDCFIFHDVDLIPLNENNNYTCGDSPRHHAANLARWNHRLPYAEIFGGVISFKSELFRKVNGYSNVYFVWGGEDDDLYNRVKFHDINVSRYHLDVSTYGDLKHVKSEPESNRMKYLAAWRSRVKVDGLNSLKYQIHFIEYRKLYTRIYVGLNETGVLKQFPIV